MYPNRALCALAVCALLTGCVKTDMEKAPEPSGPDRKDYHSYSNSDQVQVRHVKLDLTVDFTRKVLRGNAVLNFDRTQGYTGPLILDTRALQIEQVEASNDGMNFTPTKYQLGANDPILGAPLTIQLPPESRSVRVSYTTSPQASGLQWLSPAQTAGKKLPYLYSQNQPIHARSWIPIPDSPGWRLTYSARIRTPKEVTAVMSAQGSPDHTRTGDYTFEMPQTVPAYLIALAVGDIQFKPMTRRTGVFAEPSILEAAAREFEDTENMIVAAESLYGQYHWERYDILVLPPSFPYGGMENPRLTFVTPSLIAGDKSLVAVISHELAHSWSGNLATNATWSDFWLNEGFTTYVERRIQEKIFGLERSQMEAVLERRELDDELKTLKPRDQLLHPDLKGRDPDDNSTEVPYVKGMLFLRQLEEVFGRDRFDPFLRSWFDTHLFQSVTTQDFVNYLQKNLLQSFPDLARRVPVQDWITQPGLPATAPNPHAEAFDRVDSAAKKFLAGADPRSLSVAGWTTQHWVRLLNNLPDPVDRKHLAELDAAFHFTHTGNDEILDKWLILAAKAQYETAYPRMEQFLTHVGRMRYIVPIYTELARTPAGKTRALAIYKKARAGYHPIAQARVDELLK